MTFCEDRLTDDDDYDIYRTLTYKTKRKSRSLAKRLLMNEPCSWSEHDIKLLLDELEIEIGEGTNRFLYEDEYTSYCLYLSEIIPFENSKDAGQIYSQIIWLWSTWEAISKATGISWWNMSEEDKYNLSLMVDNKDQQLKSKFRYFDYCDRVFSYIHKDEFEENSDTLSIEESIYY